MNNNNKLIILIIFIIMNINTLHANKLTDIKKNGFLTVGIEKEFEPFNFLDENETRVGFDIDVINYIANELKVTVKFKTMEFSKLQSSVESKNIDVAIGAIIHKVKSDDKVDFSISYMYDGQSIISLKSNFYEDYKSFDGKKVGAIKGHSSGKLFEEIAPLSSVSYFKNLDQLTKALLAKKIDAATSDESVLRHTVQKNPQEFKIIGKNFTLKPYGIMMPENESKLRDEINFAIQKLVKENEYKKIYKKWFHQLPTRNPSMWL